MCKLASNAVASGKLVAGYQQSEQSKSTMRVSRASMTYIHKFPIESDFATTNCERSTETGLIRLGYCCRGTSSDNDYTICSSSPGLTYLSPGLSGGGPIFRDRGLPPSARGEEEERQLKNRLIDNTLRPSLAAIKQSTNLELELGTNCVLN